ncbi:MAG TPA: 4Fe-4S ferredoxin, partial [Deltaproteobacteria bacterium]|nr:4Fe-4S ferredoxin [Deltaproteobacteria bacterium]
MKQDIFRNLQERLDTYSLGFPATQSGVEIEILKRLFCEEDAELFLALTPILEDPQSIAKRLDKPVDELSAHLEKMSSKGLLFRLKKGDSVKYGAIPFMHGLL